MRVRLDFIQPMTHPKRTTRAHKPLNVLDAETGSSVAASMAQERAMNDNSRRNPLADRLNQIRSRSGRCKPSCLIEELFSLGNEFADTERILAMHERARAEELGSLAKAL